MEFSSKLAELPTFATACLVVGIFDGGKLTPPAQALDLVSRGYLTGIIKSDAFNGRSGQSLMLFKISGVKAERVLLIGLGAGKEFKLHAYRKAVHKAVHGLLDGGIKEAALSLTMLDVPDTDA